MQGFAPSLHLILYCKPARYGNQVQSCRVYEKYGQTTVLNCNAVLPLYPPTVLFPSVGAVFLRDIVLPAGFRSCLPPLF